MASIRNGLAVRPVQLDDGAEFRRYVRAIPLPPPSPPAQTREPVVPAMASSEERDVLGESLRFRAALSEAFERELADLFGDLAVRVVARELRLAPVELAAIARAVLAHRGESEPIALRAAPEDGERLRALAQEHNVALCLDERLCAGDVVVELRCGALESTLATRIDEVLAAHGGAA
ncbi:hypothetical protein EPN44_15000 [bacterium]|nr:MAG: hypothetical protein EPN44_15000 [bacterium]